MSSLDTPRLGLPLLAAAQAQKHVTHNEALLALDLLVQLAVEDIRAAPPDPATPDAAHIVAAAPTGAFAGRAGHVAIWRDGAWTFFAPAAGWRAFDKASGTLLVHDGAGWRPADSAVRDRLGVNMAADGVNRLAVAARGALLTHDPGAGSGSTRLTLNKAASADVASLVFQTGWSGRAELGAVGDDRLSLRVSADGASWTAGLTIDSSTGHVGVGRPAPVAPLDVAATLRLSSANRAAVMTQSEEGGDLAPTLDLDFDNAASSAPSGHLRLFRNTSASGPARLSVMRANGSAVSNCVLGGNVNTALAIVTGNVGIGVTSPDAKLAIAGQIAPSANNAWSLGRSDRAWSTVHVASGVISSSDARRKRDVAPCPLGLDFVRALAPKIYRWTVGETIQRLEADVDAAGETVQKETLSTRAGRRQHLGFLAQEVKAALDRAGLDCGLWTLADPADPDSVQGLRHEQLLAPLVAAVQELARRIERLEGRAG